LNSAVATSEVPAPASWAGLSVQAESGDPNSMLELYRSALALRKQLPGLGAEFDDNALTWLPAPEPVLKFRRGDEFVCTVNTGSEPVTLPLPGTVLLASAPVVESEQTVTLPASSAAWWSV